MTLHQVPSLIQSLLPRGRHVFEERRYAEEYFVEDVKRELGLDQAKLIRFAMLLGSDYTEGVSGIGAPPPPPSQPTHTPWQAKPCP